MRARRALLVAVAIAILALARCGASASDARAPDAVADVADVAHRASAAAAAAAASARDDDDRLPLARRRRRRRRQRAPARALLQVNNPAVATYCDYATANWRCVPLVHIRTGSHTTAFAW
jgi:hypothetical protein